MMRSRVVAAALLWLSSAHEKGVNAQQECFVKTQIEATSAYKGCQEATSVNFEAYKIKDDPTGMNFCSDPDCFAMWTQLVAIGGIKCMKNYKTDVYKLWKKADGVACFTEGGMISPAPATRSPAMTATPSTKPSPVTASAAPMTQRPGNSSTVKPPSSNAEDSSRVNGTTSGNESRGDGSSLAMWIGVGTGGVVAVLLVIIFVMYRRRRRTASFEKELSSPENGYLPTLSSRSRRSKEDAVAVLGATGIGTFMLQSSRSGMWDDEIINTVRIPYEKLSFDELISRGGYGEVYRGRYRGQLVAIKTLLQERRKDMRQIEKFLAEVRLMAALEHENIVTFIGVAWDSLHEMCVVSEFMDRGDLRTLLSQYEGDEITHPKGFTAAKIKIGLHVANALTYMHSLQPMVLHRDVKSRNILLDAHLDAKVTDFGVSRERADSTMTVGVGSSLWMAPEVMMGERYNDKADVFSFGVVLSELDLHTLPYSHAVESGSGRKLPDTVIVQMMTMNRIGVQFSDEATSPMAQLGRRCVALDPADRPSAAEMQHYINQVWRSVGVSL